MGHFISFQMWSVGSLACGQIVIPAVYLSLCMFPFLAQYPLGYRSFPSVTVHCGGVQRVWVRILGCERRVFEKVL